MSNDDYDDMGTGRGRGRGPRTRGARRRPPQHAEPTGPRVWGTPSAGAGPSDASPQQPTGDRRGHDDDFASPTPGRDFESLRDQGFYQRRRDDRDDGHHNHRRDDLHSSSGTTPDDEFEGSTARGSGRTTRRKRRWRNGMPLLCPVWHDSWGFDYCAKNPKTFEDWDRTYVGWEYRVCKYLP